MVSTRFLGVVSTSMLVVGALSVGQALHLTIVTGELGLTATPVVVYGIAGVVAIAIGYRARKPVAESYALTTDARERGEHEQRRSRTPSANEDADGLGGDASAFDPTMSPLGGSEPGDAERRHEHQADQPDENDTTDAGFDDGTTADTDDDTGSDDDTDDDTDAASR